MKLKLIVRPDGTARLIKGGDGDGEGNEEDEGGAGCPDASGEDTGK